MQLLFYLLQLPFALMVFYLDVLSFAALTWKNAPPRAVLSKRFAILVPAHNEERLLPRLLASLNALQYPNHLFDVHVVADNCTDSTAVLARNAGATVYERRDDHALGKGHALAAGLERIFESGTPYDAFVIVDADSVVSSNLLRVMNHHLARGDRVIQCYYGVANGDGSWASKLRYVSLALFNGLRPRGRDALGLSAGLHGNGMCFSTDVLRHAGWPAFGLAEDVELHLALVRAGIRTRYAPHAYVLAEMPATLNEARSQNVRWERGRLQLLRRHGPHLLRGGSLRQRLLCLSSLVELAIPPLSVLSALTVLFLALATVSRARGPRRIAWAVGLGQIGYIAVGLQLVHASAHVYFALLRAPLYVLWKVWIYGIAAVHLDDHRWIRTGR